MLIPKTSFTIFRHHYRLLQPGCRNHHVLTLATSPSSSRPRSTPLVQLSGPEVRGWNLLVQRSDPLALQNILLRQQQQQQRHHLHTTSGRRSNDNKDEKDKKEDEKKDDDNDGGDRERMLSTIKTLVGFFLVPLLLIGIFSASTNRGGDQSGDQQSGAGGGGGAGAKQVTWNDFYHNMLLAGEVEEVIVHSGVNRATVILRPDAIYKGQRVKNNVFRLAVPNSENLEDRIREAEQKLGIAPGEGISVAYERKSENVAYVLWGAFILVVFGLFLLGGRNIRASIGSSINNPFSRMTKADFTLIDPMIRSGKGVRFADVAGLREAKIEVKEFVDYLKHPEKYKELGAKPPKGAILFGPPGCGKTMLAKAVANESNVPFLSMNGSEFIEMIGGLGAARVRNLFAEARKRKPSIIYIDEIDAIGKKRMSGGGGGMGGGGGGEAEQTLNQLLVEMDGIATTEGVVMLASTNRSDVLDRALLRPGRFDRHIMIDLPTLIERKEILEQHMKGVKLAEEAPKYSERLATLTPGFSGADLANVINEAALHAARMKHDHVGKVNLEYAIERVIAGPEKKTSVLNPVERRIVAYHESGHAIVGWMLEHSDALLKVTILPRTSAALGFAQYTPTEKKLYSPEELLDRMCMALGGRAAEALTFNRVTTGAQNDLEKVTKMAYSQIRHFGFNEIVGLVSFEDTSGKKPFSKRLQATMDHEARKLIASAYQRTEELLTRHRDQLEMMAEALLKRETLNYADVEELLGPPPHKKKHLVTPADFESQLREQATLGGEAAEKPRSRDVSPPAPKE